jgi:ABC-2 type transport system ATP-binding protein
MTGLSVRVRDLVVRYGATTAVDGATFDVRAGSITGLIGRNGSGKTSILSVLAAFRRADAGTVHVGGQDPWENPAVTEEVCLIRESGDVLGDQSLRANLRFYELTRPRFSRELAEQLLDTFELPERTKPSQLSRGKRSAFGITVGLATRAPLTLLDEVHLGLDAPSRYAFYDAMLADYVEHPRTIVLSTHLVEEMQRLVEDVVVVHDGRVLLAEDADTLRARGTSVLGPQAAVEDFVRDRTVLGRQQLGPTLQVTLDGRLDHDDVARATALGLDLAPVDLQDLFVHLTAPRGAATRNEVTR